MRSFLNIIGLVFIIFSIVEFQQTNKEIKVFNEGAIAKMQIVDIPGSCLGTKVKHHMKVSYHNKIFIKRIPADYCEGHNIGEWIELKFIPESTITLFPDENPSMEFYASLFMGLAGLLIIIWYGILKKPLYTYK